MGTRGPHGTGNFLGLIRNVLDINKEYFQNAKICPQKKAAFGKIDRV